MSGTDLERGHAAAAGGKAILLAFLAGLVAGIAAIAVGMPVLGVAYPESNIAPVLAFAWFAPIAFIVVFGVGLAIGLGRAAAGRGHSGGNLLKRLARGNAPLDIAFWLPLALMFCLWPINVLGATTLYHAHYPGFLFLVGLLGLVLVVCWIWFTWANSRNAQSRAWAVVARGLSAGAGGAMLLGAVL